MALTELMNRIGTPEARNAWDQLYPTSTRLMIELKNEIIALAEEKGFEKSGNLYQEHPWNFEIYQRDQNILVVNDTGPERYIFCPNVPSSLDINHFVGRLTQKNTPKTESINVPLVGTVASSLLLGTTFLLGGLEYPLTGILGGMGIGGFINMAPHLAIRLWHRRKIKKLETSKKTEEPIELYYGRDAITKLEEL